MVVDGVEIDEIGGSVIVKHAFDGLLYLLAFLYNLNRSCERTAEINARVLSVWNELNILWKKNEYGAVEAYI